MTTCTCKPGDVVVCESCWAEEEAAEREEAEREEAERRREARREEVLHRWAKFNYDHDRD